MNVFKLYLFIILTKLCHYASTTSVCRQFDVHEMGTYLHNLLKSQAALPTMEKDFVMANVETLHFLSKNSDTYYSNEDAYLNISQESQLVIKYGFPFEQHQVTTEDGYILTLHRIPSNGPVVLLNHGILLSSVDWITAGPYGSPAFYLASRGYDVWLCNARGNRYSKRHLYLSPRDQRRFFDFTFHEIGLYDLSATVDYILRITRQTKINYVGFSQGTTAFFVLCSVRPEYNRKFNVMIALSPITWFSHSFSPVLRFLYKIELFKMLMALGKYEFLSSPEPLFKFCNNNNVFKFICLFGQYLTFGFDRGMFNYNNVPVITSHVFAGCSVKQFEHYGQLVYSGKFRQYDFGVRGNLQRYGSSIPPDYQLNRVTVPVALFYSFSDYFSSVIDVWKLRTSLPNVIGLFQAKYYHHLDYNFAKDLNSKVNKVVIHYLERFT